MANTKKALESVTLSRDGSSVIIIDQTLLPATLKYIKLKSDKDIYEAIKQLKVRGAPAIGICAAYGMAVLAKSIKAQTYEEFYHEFKNYRNYIGSSRPTAVNLFWALDEMEKCVTNSSDKSVAEIKKLLREEAISIHNEDIAVCKAISQFGLSLIENGDGILTHCNAGPLATSRYGTALGPLFLGKENGMNFHVFADETRPLLQGARITAFELHQAGIDVTLICDNMASIVMKEGKVNAVFVGCDRVAANGDAANKIGTSGVAILAKHYGIPFYVLGPTSTIDTECKTGDDIKIEQRDPSEIKEKFFAKPVALKEIKTYNPAFDVTDHALISGIITEYGVARPPYDSSLKEIMEKKNGRFSD